MNINLKYIAPFSHKLETAHYFSKRTLYSIQFFNIQTPTCRKTVKCTNIYMLFKVNCRVTFNLKVLFDPDSYPKEASFSGKL